MIRFPFVLFIFVLLLCKYASADVQYKEVVRNCSENCTRRGNCNIEDGRCECPYGFSGPTCEVGLLSACQAKPDTEPFIGFFLPKSCTCIEQLLSFYHCNNEACSSIIYLTANEFARCYKYKNGTNFQYSDLPELSDTDVSWFKHQGLKNGEFVPVTDATEAYVGNHYYLRNAVIKPFHYCKKNCTYRGACILDPETQEPNCRCMQGYDGRSCEIALTSFCPNNCSSRGVCNRGFCHCSPPYFGMDCSRSKAFEPVDLDYVEEEEEGPSDSAVGERDAAAPPRARKRSAGRVAAVIPLRNKIKIYAYELPSHIAFNAASSEVLVDRPLNYNGYELFREQLFHDWAVRTENPHEANLFYIPASIYAYTSNTANRAFEIETVIDYVRQTYPFFNRTGGRDHFIWLPADRGACYVKNTSEIMNVMKVVHFGLFFNTLEEDPKRVIHGDLTDTYHGCFNPMKDVATASHAGINSLVSKAAYSEISLNKGHVQRKHFFFFAGSMRHHQAVYSGGIRQMIHKLVQERYKDDPSILVKEGSVGDYVAAIRNSTFCLAPYGAGYGIRFYLAVAYGCIPVIIQDRIVQPFNELVPYYKFSVLMHKSEIPHLFEHLRSYSNADLAEMRMNLLKYHRAFFWDKAMKGEAYIYTIRSLVHKVSNFWSNIKRRRLMDMPGPALGAASNMSISEHVSAVDV